MSSTDIITVFRDSPSEMANPLTLSIAGLVTYDKVAQSLTSLISGHLDDYKLVDNTNHTWMITPKKSY